MACVCAPKKFMYQTPMSASVTGTLSSSLVVRKCSSISCAPARNSSKSFMPMTQAIDSPMADHIE